MKQSNSEASLREEVLKNLATAYDNFVELVANLKEGTKVCVCTRETRAETYRGGGRSGAAAAGASK